MPPGLYRGVPYVTACRLSGRTYYLTPTFKLQNPDNTMLGKTKSKSQIQVFLSHPTTLAFTANFAPPFHLSPSYSLANWLNSTFELQRPE